MSRYILPLSIVVIIGLLIGLVAFRGSGGIDFTAGVATEQPMSAEWVKGSASSSVVIIEYSDFQCPACKAYQPLLDQVTAKYGDKIALVFRNYPLYQIHPNAGLAAQAAEAAGLQGKFWQMHDRLFAAQEQWSTALSAKDFMKQYAVEIGLDMARFEQDLASDAVRKLVADDYARGRKDGVQGTPTFVINGVRLPRNPGTIAEFDALISQLLGQ